jgi:putative copper resistance protein D
MAALPPFGADAVISGWALDPGPALGVALAGGAYAWGVVRLHRRHRRWPVGRSLAFASGLLCLVVATQSALGAYDTALFSVHVVQHVLLGVAAPFLLALGAPITLALQASRRDTQVGLLWLIRSAPVRVATHPAVGFVVFGLTLFVLYTTPLYELSLRNDWVHSAVHLHFVLAGSIFFWSVVGLDPVAHRLPYGARLLVVLLTVPFHAFLGIMLLSGDTPIAGDWYAAARDWGVSPLTDQRTGGAVMWALGDVIGLVAGAVVLAQWMAHEDRATERARRAEARAARADGPEPGAAPAGGASPPPAAALP